MLSSQSKRTIFVAGVYGILVILSYFLNKYVTTLVIILGFILLVIPFLKQKYFNITLFYALIIVLISTNFYILQLQSDQKQLDISNQTLSQCKECNRKIIGIQTSCLDKIENITKSFQNFDCGIIQQENEICYSNVTLVKSPKDTAILIDECDFYFVGKPLSMNTSVGTIVTTISPRWKDENKHILISLSDKMVMYVENGLLKFKIVELDNTEHILISDIPINWNNEIWYELASEWNVDTGEIKLFYNETLVAHSTIKNLNIQMNNLTFYWGVDSEGRYQANAAFDWVGFSYKSVEELTKK
ncbi:hypothetical protein HYU09_04535 [Candidatus Woesearchaeota archaeon]|nr:hypothetical protein [Candidatus Woesearchaeota archaeon]